jgi:hypothetical protein
MCNSPLEGETFYEAAFVAAKTRRKGMDERDLRRATENIADIANRQLLRDELPASGLPEIAQRKVEKEVLRMFAGRVATTADVKIRINEEKNFLTEFTGSSGGQINVLTEQPERVQAAMDKAFGLDVDSKFRDVKPLGLRAAYDLFTGDEDVSGVIRRMSPDRERLNAAFCEYMNLSAAFSTASFAFALGNTLYRRLIKAYKAVDFSEDILISYKRNAKDFKTLESVRIGYFQDLPDVNPEVQDYSEITMIDDEEIAYHLNQKGVILSCTRRAILNDDLRSIDQMAAGLGRAAKRTFARRVWNPLINNATFQPDGLAIFCLTHGNLGTLGLTNDATGIATLTAAMAQMYYMTEKDSGETLALQAKYEAVPRQMQETARALNQPWPMGGQFNPHAGYFGRDNERIKTCPLLIDQYDWYLIAAAEDTELIEVAFLNGREEPEMVIADNPLVGQMFTSDKLQYKIRHEYECAAADYRGFFKGMAAGQ